MAVILNIETSTKNCSVSIAKEGKILSLKEINNGAYSHAEMLHPLIVEALEETKLTIEELSAVAVGKGPGSYTGLRIGVSAAKGLCFTHNIPLIAINSLEILSLSCVTEKGVIIPMIDARRMEVYSAIFNYNYQRIRKTEAEIITENSFLEYLEKGPVYFLGDGAEKCKETISNENAFFIDGKFPSAKEMAEASYDKFKKSDMEDVAYFEPFYLKDFVATKEKKKL
ncbi:MAG: tRNA (adenosine(37)-N6)-threonylcarbamoyltransferase complex dimerization subunit type 1 TsaB [Flavobacteriaceae bacterium]